MSSYETYSDGTGTSSIAGVKDLGTYYGRQKAGKPGANNALTGQRLAPLHFSRPKEEERLSLYQKILAFDGKIFSEAVVEQHKKDRTEGNVVPETGRTITGTGVLAAMAWLREDLERIFSFNSIDEELQHNAAVS